MNTFTLTYFLFAGGFVLVVWALVFLDVVGPGIARIVKRAVARTRAWKESR